MDGNSIKQTPETQPRPTSVSPETVSAQPAFENLSASSEVAPIKTGKETEQSLNRSEAQPTTQPVATPVPQTDQTTAILEPVAQPATPVTGEAGHGDKIESHWVTKLDQVLAENNEDPHNKKTEVDRLREDYQARRYGAGEG